MSLVVYVTDREYVDPLERPDWHNQAACGRNGILGDDPAERVNLMFPKKGGLTLEVRDICATCPVTTECRQAGNTERYGTWAKITRSRADTTRPGVPGRPPGYNTDIAVGLLGGGQWHHRGQIIAEMRDHMPIRTAQATISRLIAAGHVEQADGPTRLGRQIRSTPPDHTQLQNKPTVCDDETAATSGPGRCANSDSLGLSGAPIARPIGEAP